jgi:ketosteroid isomerase-like protein
MIERPTLEGGWMSTEALAVTPETLAAIAQAFNDHDADAVLSFFADDAVFLTPRGPDPWGRRLVGIEQVREGVEARFAGIPDVHYGDGDHWVSGDRGVSEWLLTGTTVDGQKLALRGCDLWTFRDGKVVCKDSYWKIVE